MPPRNPVTRRLLVVNTLASLLHAGIALALTFWTQDVLVRQLRIDEFALYTGVLGVNHLLPWLLGAPLSLALARFQTVAWVSGDDERVVRITTTLVPVAVAVALLVLVSGALAWTSGFFGDLEAEQLPHARSLMGSLLLVVVLQIALSPFLFGFYIRQKLWMQSLIGIGSRLGHAAAVGLLSSLSELSAAWMIHLVAIAGLAELAISFLVSRRLVPALRFDRRLHTTALLRPVLGFAGWSLLLRGANVLHSITPWRALFSAHALSSLRFPSTLGRQFLSGHLIHSAEPAAVTLEALEERSRMRALWFRLCRYALWAQGALVLPLAVYVESLLPLWLGEQAASDHPRAPILGRLLAAQSFALFAAPGIHMLAVATNRMRELALRTLVVAALFATLALVLHFGFDLGLTGWVGAGLVLAVLGQPALIWPLGLALTGTTWRAWLRECVWPGVLPAIVALPLWITGVREPAPETWPTLAVTCGVGWVAFTTALAFALRAEDRADLAALRRWCTASLRRVFG